MAVFETLKLEIAGNVATVTINRPQAMNSFTAKMVSEFRQLWRAIAEDDGIHVVVLRAAPGRAFSTGADVKQPAADLFHPNVFTAADPGEGLGPKANKCWKPVVAAVHGLCAAGAFYWINECDIVICSEDATFFDPHVTYGLTAALEPIGLTYRIPLGEVLRMTLLGNDERISANTALRIGLVSEVVSLEALWPRAHALATKIANKPAAAIQGSVRAIWESLDMHRSIALQTALKYTQVGNPVSLPTINRESISAQPKKFEIR